MLKQSCSAAIVAAGLWSALANAQGVPLRTSYQGYLTDRGAPANGSYTLTFALYTVASGANGPLDGPETQTVSVTNGSYAVDLGTGTNPLAIGTDFNTQTTFLEISVNGQVLSPRQEIDSVPYAAYAGWIDNPQGYVTVPTATFGGGPTQAVFPLAVVGYSSGGSQTAGQFGDTIPVFLVQNDPSIGFNTDYSATNGWTTFTPNAYTGIIGLDSAAGDFVFAPGGKSPGRPQASNPVIKMRLTNSGALVLGTDAEPSVPTSLFVNEPAGRPLGVFGDRNPVSIEADQATVGFNAYFDPTDLAWMGYTGSGNGSGYGGYLTFDQVAGQFNFVSAPTAATDATPLGTATTEMTINGIGVSVTNDFQVGGNVEIEGGQFQVGNGNDLDLYQGNGFDNLNVASTSNRNANVTIWGGFGVSGNKNFIADDPEDPTKEVVYVTLEGPEANTFVRGTAKLTRGRNHVEIPHHFALVTNPQKLTIQVTPSDECQGWVTVSHKSVSGFDLHERGGSDDCEVDYVVIGERLGFENNLVIRDRPATAKR